MSMNEQEKWSELLALTQEVDGPLSELSVFIRQQCVGSKLGPMVDRIRRELNAFDDYLDEIEPKEGG